MSLSVSRFTQPRSLLERTRDPFDALFEDLTQIPSRLMSDMESIPIMRGMSNTFSPLLAADMTESDTEYNFQVDLPGKSSEFSDSI
jgi:hypothetical protein